MWEGWTGEGAETQLLHENLTIVGRAETTTTTVGEADTTTSVNLSIVEGAETQLLFWEQLQRNPTTVGGGGDTTTSGNLTIVGGMETQLLYVNLTIVGRTETKTIAEKSHCCGRGGDNYFREISTLWDR